MAAKKILFLVGDFAEDYEVMVPFHSLTMVGHIRPCRVPRQKGGANDQDRDPRFRRRSDLTEKRGHNFALNATFAEVKAGDYDALMIAGGRAPEYLRLNDRLIDIVRSFAADQKPIAAICHAAQILAAADVIRGRRVSGYSACAPEVRLAGAEFVDTEPDRPFAMAISSAGLPGRRIRNFWPCSSKFSARGFASSIPNQRFVE
jgi:protease I